MDTSRLERFARYARRYLIEQTEKKLIQILTYTDGIESEQRRAYPQQVKALETEILDRYGITIEKGATAIDTKKMADLIDMVAYTWFNRFCALRYMDMNQYNKIGVVSPLPGHFQPEILEEAKAGYIDETMVSEKDRKRVFDLISGAETHPDPQHEAYRVLVRAVSNYYAHLMPFLFDPIAKWKELLMPEDLLSGESILSYTREAMTPKACRSVEVIGWLYQYYISEKQEYVQTSVKRKKSMQSSEIPAVTQYFTPKWIVKYMVENSLGRLWMKNNPNSNLKDKMEYYIEDSEENVAIDQGFYRIDSPEEIRFCDPCCGSGHVLSYAFDLLYHMYDEMGYDPITIPILIIEENLYGIELDGRAAELAAFVLSMRALECDKYWFDNKIEPNICQLKNIKIHDEEMQLYFKEIGHNIFTCNFERMLNQFEDVETFGSLIVPYEQDIQGIKKLLDEKDFSSEVFLAPIHNKMLQIIEQADYLSTKYQVVVTNPPYLRTTVFDKKTKTWFKNNYPRSSPDFFAMFIERSLQLAYKQCFVALVNTENWMFLKSYEMLRRHLVKNYEFVAMTHLGQGAFDSVGVATTSFILQNTKPRNKLGIYIDLIDGKSTEEKRKAYLHAIAKQDCGFCYKTITSDFSKVPGSPIAYWVSDKIRDIFSSSKPLAEIASPKQGLATADNDRFLRLWFETSHDRIGFGMKNREEARQSVKKWFPYNKGGEFRKWYGNQDYVVNWENDGEDIRNNYNAYGKLRSRPQNADFYFKPCLSWSRVSAENLAMRFIPPGFLFDATGCSIFSNSYEKEMIVLGLTNSVVIGTILKILSPTLNTQAGEISNLPFRMPENYCFDSTELMISLSKKDWNSYETSWDFQFLPLFETREKMTSVKEAYNALRVKSLESTLTLQKLEEKNNRIFIETYELSSELSPKVSLNDISLISNPYYRYRSLNVKTEGLDVMDNDHFGQRSSFPVNEDLEKRLLSDTMKELISYGVGCMFGRYSLNEPGLIIASQGEVLGDRFEVLGEAAEPLLGVRSQVLGVRGDSSEALKPKTYKLKPKPYLALNNVIPILDEEWFADDMINMFSDFLKDAFGEDNFEENLRFIENAIGKDIRRYFIRDFYNDHVKMYKRRPIYWLFSSPKGSFNALIYMHRYSPDTASIILNDYLREYVFKLNNKLSDLRNIEISADNSQREKTQASKEIDKIESIITELEYWEKDYLYPLAAKRVEIDLDDGVKVNYALFEGALKGVRI